jgi:hypothetical protein
MGNRRQRDEGANAVHVVSEAESAQGHAMMATGSARLFKRSNRFEKFREHKSLLVRLTVCKNDDVDVAARSVIQR